MKRFYIETETGVKYTEKEFKIMYTGAAGKRELKYLKSLDGDLNAAKIAKLKTCKDLINYLLDEGIYTVIETEDHVKPCKISKNFKLLTKDEFLYKTTEEQARYLIDLALYLDVPVPIYEQGGLIFDSAADQVIDNIYDYALDLNLDATDFYQKVFVEA